MKFIDTDPSITRSDVEQFENNFPFRYPQKYWEHLLKHNGGYPEHAGFEAPSGKTSVAGFYSLKHGTNTLEWALKVLKVVKPVLPEHLVPFAYDGGDNQFCFSTRESDRGSVSVYWHDREEEEFLADSFEKFMKQLRPESGR